MVMQMLGDGYTTRTGYGPEAQPTSLPLNLNMSEPVLSLSIDDLLIKTAFDMLISDNEEEEPATKEKAPENDDDGFVFMDLDDQYASNVTLPSNLMPIPSTPTITVGSSVPR